MPDAARARDSPGPNIRMLQKTIAGCRVSSRFFRRACTRASGGRSGGRRGARAGGRWGGGRRRAPGRGTGPPEAEDLSGPARHGPARLLQHAHNKQIAFSRQFSNILFTLRDLRPRKSLFLDKFFDFCREKWICSTVHQMLNHRAEVLEALERPKRPSDRLSFGPPEGSVPSTASARAGMRGPRRAEARGPRRAVPKAASDRRSKASRPLGQSAARPAGRSTGRPAGLPAASTPPTQSSPARR